MSNGKTQTEINRNTVNNQYTRLSGVGKTNRMSWFAKRRFGNI